jgi:hypothetical protein
MSAAEPARGGPARRAAGTHEWRPGDHSPAMLVAYAKMASLVAEADGERLARAARETRRRAGLRLRLGRMLVRLARLTASESVALSAPATSRRTTPCAD